MLKNSPGLLAGTCRGRIVSILAQRSALALATIAVLVLLGAAAGRSQASTTPVPDAPDPAAAQVKKTPAGPAVEPAPLGPRLHQTKRILGIIPNFRSVSTDEVLPPQSAKEKFVTTTQDSFDYSAVLVPAVLAGYGMARNSTPEFRQGAVGYSRYLWHAAADQTIENYMVEFIFPSLTHEDNRYYTLGRGGFWRRAGYAMSRSVVTRTDSGRNAFNFSEVVGAGASAGVSSLYYPSKERTFSNVAQSWALDVGIDAFTFSLKEFWPDVNNRWFHFGEPKH